MKLKVAVTIFLLALSCNAIYADQSDRVGKLADAVTKASVGKTGEYAKELISASQASLSEALILAKAGREKDAEKKLALAELQLKAATVKAEEKELIELVAVKRAELKKSEAKLEQYRQDEEN